MINLIGAFLLQSSDGSAGMIGLGFLVVWLAIAVLSVVSAWIVFTKAGEPGWASIVPIYNAFVILRIAGKPAWWFVLFLIPLVNIVIIIMVGVSLAQNFGKGTGFGVGLAFLGFIFLPILAFSDAQYSPVS